MGGNLPAALPTVGGQGASSGARPSVIQLVFREKSALYAAYIPSSPTAACSCRPRASTSSARTSTCCCPCPTTQRYPVAGKVAWITPANASGGRTQGVGVRFPGDEKTRVLRVKIEEILGTAISSAKPTQTI
jgi:type IV pilus assembly protein PilZ